MSGTAVQEPKQFDRWRDQPVEWWTLGLLVACLGTWCVLVLAHRAVPAWVSVPVFAVLGGWWLSLQHELLHGHPFRRTEANTAIGFLPLTLWMPYTRYKTLHIEHHRSDLTDPFGDPESFYMSPEAWQKAGTLRRAYILAGRTLLGRLIYGSVRGVIVYVSSDLRLAIRDRRVRNEWIAHIAAAAALAWLLFGVIGVPAWEYLLGFVYGGYMATMLRSFAEHCAVPSGTRSAVVKAGPVLSLLYLNNNLHHTHHAAPDVPWYLIPDLHRALGSDAIAAEGAGLYRGGYVELVRRHLFSPFCQPDHPLSAGARPIGSRGLQ
jgi:fatty acid desaturase